MTPKQLDYVLNGAKVFIYKRPSDGAIYPSLEDFSRFGVKALDVVRVKLSAKSTAESVLADPKVVAACSRS
ncbi:hypothetical protein [Bradyrhizobium sp. 33ap4]|uniref:hypothetical protein n=1 Tax=Bradyrhizobium sp. 33ap4 TaxID=3061630 RepID=UPI00292FA3D5|nr:hypothetical protein [Bradyrhizobium sp. 33ap4]